MRAVALMVMAFVITGLPALAQTNTSLTAAQFAAQFRCPESVSPEEARADLENMFDWAKVQQPPWTAADFITFRVKMLEEHHCTQTLENIRRNNENPEK